MLPSSSPEEDGVDGWTWTCGTELSGDVSPICSSIFLSLSSITGSVRLYESYSPPSCGIEAAGGSTSKAFSRRFIINQFLSPSLYFCPSPTASSQNHKGGHKNGLIINLREKAFDVE